MKRKIQNIWIETKQSTEFATHKREVFFGIAKTWFHGFEKILDIGSGSGAFINFIGRNDIYSLDGNIVTVKKLKKVNSNVVHSILPNIPFSNDSFDGIHISHILEHLYHKDVYMILKEVDRVLKKNGVFI